MTKDARRRLTYLHAARLEAAYDIVAKIRQQWIDEMQDVRCIELFDECESLQILIREACVAVTKAHAAMLAEARAIDYEAK